MTRAKTRYLAEKLYPHLPGLMDRVKARREKKYNRGNKGTYDTEKLYPSWPPRTVDDLPWQSPLSDLNERKY